MKEDEVAIFWDANASRWDEFRHKGYDTYRLLSFALFQERLGPIKGKRLVDLGCGEGYNTRVSLQKQELVCSALISVVR